MASWQVDTGQYVPRISIAFECLRSVVEQTKDMLQAPRNKPPSVEEQIAFSLAAFARGAAVASEQLIDNLGLLWSQGRMVGVSGLARLSLEFWAALNFGLNIFERYISDKNIDLALEKTARLTFSAKTPVALSWGGHTTNVAYSILTFIDKLDRRIDGAKDDYNFLCEASHPNFLQNTYFVMASKIYEGNENDRFRSHAQNLLERTICIVEKVASGVSADSLHLLKITEPFIQH